MLTPQGGSRSLCNPPCLLCLCLWAQVLVLSVLFPSYLSLHLWLCKSCFWQFSSLLSVELHHVWIYFWCVLGGSWTQCPTTYYVDPFCPHIYLQIHGNPNQNTGMLFLEINKPFLKLRWKYKEPRLAKTSSKKNKIGGLALADFQVLLECYSDQNSVVLA